MNTTTSKLGADMTDDEREAIQSGIAAMEKCGWTHRVPVLRAILARQPAAIDKQEAVAYRDFGRLAQYFDDIGDPHGANVIRTYRDNLYAAPLANEASKPAAAQRYPSEDAYVEGFQAIQGSESVAEAVFALWAVFVKHASPAAPSVEQDERGASWAPERIWLQRGIGEQGSHTWCEDSIDDCEQAEYMRISRESCPTCHGNDSDLPCAFPEGGKPGCPRDIRLARAASTSANVAQGAEAVAWFIPDDNGEVYRTTGYEHERDQWRALGHAVFPLYTAPPAQTAITEQMLEKLYWTAMDNSADILKYMEEAIALTAAQSASGETK